jgi:hypothetical protein
VSHYKAFDGAKFERGSQTRCALVPKLPRERPSAWSSGSTTCAAAGPPAAAAGGFLPPARAAEAWARQMVALTHHKSDRQRTTTVLFLGPCKIGTALYKLQHDFQLSEEK